MDSESDAPKKRVRRYEWDSLRALGSSRLVQFTVVLPVIGYLILFSTELREFFVLVIDRDQPLDFSGTPQPILWRLYFLYFGFCFVAVASLIFSWRCPSAVKTHGAGFVYLEKEGPAISEMRLKAIREYVALDYLRALHTTGLPQHNTSLAETFLYGEQKPPTPQRNENLTQVENDFEKCLDLANALVRGDALLEYFVALKQSRRAWRIATRWCYDIGFALLAVPTLHVFFSVVAAVYDDITSAFLG